MDFTLSDDHKALRDSARVFLDKEVDLAAAPQAWRDGGGRRL